MTADDPSGVCDIDLSPLERVSHWKHPFYTCPITVYDLPASVHRALSERIREYLLEEKRAKELLETLRDRERLGHLAAGIQEKEGTVSMVEPRNKVRPTPEVIIAEIRRLIIEERKKARERELEQKRNRMEQIDIEVAQLQKKLESLNAKKHELFSKFRALSQNPKPEDTKKSSDEKKVSSMNQSEPFRAENKTPVNSDKIRRIHSPSPSPPHSHLPPRPPPPPHYHSHSKNYSSRRYPSPPSFNSRDSRSRDHFSEQSSHGHRFSHGSSYRSFGSHRSSGKSSLDLEKRMDRRGDGSPRNRPTIPSFSRK